MTPLQNPKPQPAWPVMPLKNIGRIDRYEPSQLMGDGKVFGAGRSRSQFRTIRPCVQCTLLQAGTMPILIGRTTPILAWEEGAGLSSVTLCYEGSPSYQDGITELQIGARELMVIPRHGGQINTGNLASINFPIEHRRLRRTMQILSGGDAPLRIDQPLALKRSEGSDCEGKNPSLFSFFAFLDDLLLESLLITEALGIDEQIYRLLAIGLFRSRNLMRLIERRYSKDEALRSHGFDDLIDYIRAHAHGTLTLTDLQERSHYSARHLQMLFRQRFDCTPMQFVRRQRLTDSMDRLQNARWDDTVTSVARACGYRSTSSFSTDFQRQFGIRPSAVLRSAHTQPPGTIPAQGSRGSNARA